MNDEEQSRTWLQLIGCALSRVLCPGFQKSGDVGVTAERRENRGRQEKGDNVNIQTGLTSTSEGGLNTKGLRSRAELSEDYVAEYLQY